MICQQLQPLKVSYMILLPLRLLALHTHIWLERKWISMSNNIAHYAAATITAEKSFIVQASSQILAGKARTYSVELLTRLCSNVDS